MSLTIRELTEMTELRTRFLAGVSGGDRPVVWAHTTELPNPWNWLGTGDLLLTNGLSLPRDPEGQVHMLQELNRANLSGVAFGEGPQAPPITSEALAAADEMNFPVLASEYSVPWVTLVHIVADSNAQKGYRRIAKVIRAYDVLRRSHSSPESSDRLLPQLGIECECVLHVLDRATGIQLLPPAEPLPEAVRAAILERLAPGADPLPAFSRISIADAFSFLLPIAESPRAVLVATPMRDQSNMDLMVLQHASTIVGLEVERRASRAFRRRESGARLLQHLLSGNPDLETAVGKLAAHDLDAAPWRVLRWGTDSQYTAADAEEAFARVGVPFLVQENELEVFALIPAESLGAVREALATVTTARVGSSMPLHKLSGIDDAAREARWALEAARSARETISVYGDSGPPFLPRLISEGQSVVERILGPILTYDRDNDAQLLLSLMAYFDANRSWQKGADALGIHRQTLIYRLGRIETITGRRLQNIVDLTDLYLAVQTWRMLQARTGHGEATKLLG